MTFPIIPPYPMFTDRDGDPLDDGYIYIGVANLNPQTNPITVYWDAAGTIPASQPLRTEGGYVYRNGTPANLFAGQECSITVRDRRGRLVYSAGSLELGIAPFSGPTGSGLIGFIQLGTGAIARTVLAKLRELGVSINDFATATQALAASQGEVLFPAGTEIIGTGLTPTDVIVRGRAGSVIEASNAIDILTVNGFVIVDALSFDIFRNAIDNPNTGAPPVDVIVQRSKFTNGDGGPVVNIESPIARLLVIANRFETNEAAQIRIGQNTQALQAGWKAAFVALNTIDGVSTTGSAGTVGGILCYAPLAKIIGNDIRNVDGDTALDEVFFIYTKSIGAVIALNTGDQISGNSIVKYGINLKGAPRGDTSSPQGYGAMALGNSLRQAASAGAVGIQMQADEQAIIANWIDSFHTGIELGTSIVSQGILALNRAVIDGLSGSEFMAGSVEGSQFLEALNITRGGEDGTRVTVPTGKTFDRYSVVGSHHQGSGAGSGGTGVQVTGVDTDSVTQLDLSHTTIDGFTAGVNLSNVKGAKISHLSFSNVTNVTNSKRPYAFTTCKNIRAIDAFNTTLETTGATATNCFEMPLSDANVLHLKIKAIARRPSDGTVVFLERQCVAKQEAGTATVVDSSTLVEMPSGTSTGLDFTIASNRVRARVIGVAAETWDWTVWVDFELL